MTFLTEGNDGAVVAEIPDCRVCRDTGQVTCPCMSHGGILYLGHGLVGDPPAPCECPVCRDWPEEMVRWADRRAPAIPEKVAKGKAPRNWTVLACRCCPEGRRFHEWLQTPRHIGDKGAEWKFVPTPARRVAADSAEGQKLLLSREEREERATAFSVAH